MTQRVVIVSGRSGSGKSAALGALEDAGYTCIDNLPVAVLATTIELLERREPPTPLAFGIDARGSKTELAALPTTLATLANLGKSTRLLWLDADSATLVARFHATRRRHPLLKSSGSLEDALKDESDVLAPICDNADRHIDTTRLSLHDLRAAILREADPDYEAPLPSLYLVSFGFKHRVPDALDFVFDARFLPNPYWDTSLRKFDGRDKPVADFLRAQPDTLEYLDQLEALIARWGPTITGSGRPNVAVGIGCTGGQHRSVFLVETLAARLKDRFDVNHRHQELRVD